MLKEKGEVGSFLNVFFLIFRVPFSLWRSSYPPVSDDIDRDVCLHQCTGAPGMLCFSFLPPKNPTVSTRSPLFSWDVSLSYPLEYHCKREFMSNCEVCPSCFCWPPLDRIDGLDRHYDQLLWTAALHQHGHRPLLLHLQSIHAVHLEPNVQCPISTAKRK